MFSWWPKIKDNAARATFSWRSAEFRRWQMSKCRSSFHFHVQMADGCSSQLEGLSPQGFHSPWSSAVAQRWARCALQHPCSQKCSQLHLAEKPWLWFILVWLRHRLLLSGGLTGYTAKRNNLNSFGGLSPSQLDLRPSPNPPCCGASCCQNLQPFYTMTRPPRCKRWSL